MPGPYPAAMQKLVDQFTNADLAESKVVQVGAFQPHDVVRVHNNPGELVLTNTYQGDVANNTVVLLTDDATRTGLKFKPDISALNRPGQHLSLVVASTIDQSISIELEGYPAKTIEVEANVPSITNIGSLFGIPLLASTASFFDVATGEEGGDASGLINADSLEGNLVYTGGNIDFSGELGSKAAFAFSKEMPLGASLQVTWPDYSINTYHVFEQVFLLVSEHASPVTALQNRSTSTTLLATDKTYAGNNNGLFVEKFLLGGTTPELEYINRPQTRIKATLTEPGGDPELSEGGIYLFIEDLDAEASETYASYLPDATTKPMYCHVVVIVKPDQVGLVDPALVSVPYSYTGVISA